MPVEVVLESAGGHVFDLAHLRREGAEDLLRLLLEEAGYHDHLWRVRVEKKQSCGAQTRPVMVLGPRKWCCYVKIKPGDNNTAHYCSLLMPAGMKSEPVYEALKKAERRFDRNWRHGLCEVGAPLPAAAALAAAADAVPDEPGGAADEAAAPGEVPPDAGPSPAPAEAAAAEAASEPPAELPLFPEAAPKTDLHRWTKDPERMRLTLLALLEVEQEGPWPTKAAFVNALADKMGWQGVNRQEIAGVFRSLVRTGHIQPVRQGSRDLGYTLTNKGTLSIRDLLPGGEAPPEPRPTEAAAAPDAAQLILDFTGLAQQFADASQRLRANRARRAELAAEVERLDAEAAEIGRLLGDPEVRELVRRLLQSARAPAAPPRPSPRGDEGDG